MSDSRGLVDFAIRLVNSVVNLLGRQLKSWGDSSNIVMKTNCLSY